MSRFSAELPHPGKKTISTGSQKSNHSDLIIYDSAVDHSPGKSFKIFTNCKNIFSHFTYCPPLALVKATWEGQGTSLRRHFMGCLHRELWAFRKQCTRLAIKTWWHVPKKSLVSACAKVRQQGFGESRHLIASRPTNNTHTIAEEQLVCKTLTFFFH